LFSWLSCKDDAPTRPTFTTGGVPTPTPEAEAAPEPAAPAAPTPETTRRDLLTALIASNLRPCDAAAVASRMATDCPLGAAGALLMLNTLVQACRAGAVVSGSAALYLEMVRNSVLENGHGDPVGWWPGDIDCWVDRPADGVRVLNALVPHGLRVEAVHRHESVVYRGEWPAARPSDRPNNPDARSPYAAEICQVELASGIKVQVISQKVPEGHTQPDCGCAVRHQVCDVCLRHAPGASTRYSDAWPTGRPDARFDLDVPAVRVVQAVDGRLEMRRSDGVPTRPRINIRAHALWELDAHDQPKLVGEIRLRNLEGRLQKYARCGWTEVTAPAVVVVNGQAIVTPASVLARLGATADTRVLCGSKGVDYVTN